MCELCVPPRVVRFFKMTEKELEALPEEELNEVLQELDTIPTSAQHWRNRGAYYGYPSCCINAFVRRSYDTPFTQDEKDYAMEGFLPCKKHLKMIKRGLIKIEDLIQNRQCPTPFPIDDLDTKKR